MRYGATDKQIEEKIKEIEKAIGRKLTNVEKNAIKRTEE
jgi:DNA recombination-dependent growth factor C